MAKGGGKRSKALGDMERSWEKKKSSSIPEGTLEPGKIKLGIQ